MELEKNGNVFLKASGEGSKPYQVFPNLSKVFSLGRVGGQLCNMGALQREQKIATQNMPSSVACAAGLMGGKSRLVPSLLHFSIFHCQGVGVHCREGQHLQARYPCRLCCLLCFHVREPLTLYIFEGFITQLVPRFKNSSEELFFPRMIFPLATYS